MSAVPTRERLAARVRALEARRATASDDLTRERVALLLSAASDDLNRWSRKGRPRKETAVSSTLTVTRSSHEFPHPASGATVVGWTNDVLPGVFVAWSGELDLLYPLTNCCGADLKGSANVQSGVVCRACYREQPAELASQCRFADAGGC